VNEGYALRAKLWQPGASPAELTADDVLARAGAERDGVLWVHITADSVAATSKLLTESFGFHPLAVEDAFSAQERPALQEYPDALFLVAPAVVTEPHTELYQPVAFFVCRSSLVTVTHGGVPVLDRRFDEWLVRSEDITWSPAALLHVLLDAIVDDYFPASDRIEEEIDGLEDSVYQSSRLDIAEALRIKRRILEIRRHIAPIRDILNSVLRRDVELVPLDAKPYFQDVYDHALRLTETVDLNREILTGVLDAQLAVVSNNLNVVMRFMTAIATILMSMALIAGVYGMNFAHMPELQWRWGYAFAWGVMASIAGLEVWYFRRRGWW
jgi:magnesium transporter